jgi:antitoxin MazE
MFVDWEIAMKVSKWGNSLAIRLPAELVERLGLKEGDELDYQSGFSESSVAIRRKLSREERLKRLEEIRKTVKWPADYKFDREEANSRGK